MRPPHWHPPVQLSPAEQTIISRIKRAKLFIFLRHNRHELFNDEFQAELAKIFTRQHGRSMPSATSAVSLGANSPSLYRHLRR